MIRVTAYSKINFFLEITGKRPDKYHTLSTVFQTISLGDRLAVRSAEGLSMTCSEKSLPTDERNLVMKAALRLREALHEKKGAAIHLEKITPMGAGLGGGSSDAAAVLQALLKLWKRRIAAPALHQIAVGLGADVPFFLKKGLCYAEGIGDQLKALKPIPKTWMVVVWPGFGVPTKDAYAKVKLPFRDPAPNPLPIRERARRSGGEGWTGPFFNRFEDLVFPDYPALPRLKAELIAAGASQALMSGSGSAVYGLVGSKSQGERILSRLQKKYNHAWLVHTI